MCLLALGITAITIFGMSLGIFVLRRNYSATHMAPPVALSFIAAGLSGVTYAEFSLVFLPLIINVWEFMKLAAGLLQHNFRSKALKI